MAQDGQAGTKANGEGEKGEKEMGRREERKCNCKHQTAVSLDLRGGVVV